MNQQDLKPVTGLPVHQDSCTRSQAFSPLADVTRQKWFLLAVRRAELLRLTTDLHPRFGRVAQTEQSAREGALTTALYRRA
jgi:hypothetical protein